MAIDHIHAAFTVFPAACFPLALLFECGRLLLSPRESEAVRNDQLPWIMVCAGTVGAIGAFVSGLYAAEEASRYFVVPDDAIAFHYELGRLLLLVALLTTALWAVARAATHFRTAFFAAARICLISLVGISLYTGYIGGELVRNYGAGVRAEGTQPTGVEGKALHHHEREQEASGVVSGSGAP
jgi:uncharacterized membrane protein